MGYHRFDAVIVGAGGAGLMAAIQMAGKANVAVVSKLYPHALAHRRRSGRHQRSSRQH